MSHSQHSADASGIQRHPSADVLVADDDLEAADTLAALLRQEGYVVQVAYDGAVAMELAEALRPRIAVLDIAMPCATGTEVARYIRQQAWGARLRLIALTGWGSEEVEAHTRACGFDVHLVKPAGVREVMAAFAVRASQRAYAAGQHAANASAIAGHRHAA